MRFLLPVSVHRMRERAYWYHTYECKTDNMPLAILLPIYCMCAQVWKGCVPCSL